MATPAYLFGLFALPDDDVDAPPKVPTRRRRKISPKKQIELLIKGIDPAECGPPCATAPVPPEITALRAEFSDLFPAKLPPGLPPPRPTDHRIDFPERFRIPDPRLYRLAPAEDLELRKTLQDLLAHGFIKEVTSPFGSGTFFVPKANGKFRMVIDYRPINRLTVLDKYALPKIDEMLDQVGKRLNLFQAGPTIRLSSNSGSSRACRTHRVQDKIWNVCIFSNAVWAM